MIKNKKGFTLTEVIVVVVVLAVLMAVSVPSVLKYIREADHVKYMTLSRAINEEVSVYVAKTISYNKDKEFSEVITDLKQKLSYGSKNELSNIISTEPFDDEKIYSIDLCFDGKNINGWDYDKSLKVHTLSKVSIWYCQKESTLTNMKGIKFIVNLVNRKMYFYDEETYWDAVISGKEEAPIYVL
ncbi:MAG: prepilin-type N-terminal cleavage/methylation domain-containing protein [Coprobacillus sp.]